ncbi:MAG: hypothetical protein LWX83_11150 [Anaerolineae bacterium]|nr:hypothetical protein [Anaerolineae bacterium]
MKPIIILTVEIIVSAALVALGLSGKRFLFIEGPRSAAITLAVIGMFICSLSVGRFINASPAHPLSILGYIIGALGLLALLTQIFGWSLPYLADGRTALIFVALALVSKGIIARFFFLLSK